MIDITEDLKLYKELEPIWDKYLWREMVEGIIDQDWGDYPAKDDPRLNQFVRLKSKLGDIAMQSDVVTITDSTLHRVFHAIRMNVFDENVDQDGTVFSDDFFYEIADKYHPRDIAPKMAATKPLVSLNLIPTEVESLISETREAYCLGLPTACISLCRSTVERVIVDIAVRCGRIEDEDRLGQMGMCDRISLLIDRSVSHSSPLRKEINAFMAATSNVIHSNAEAVMTSALKLYHDSLGVILALYGQYKNQFKK
jgi:hypothetical protein